MIYSRCLASVVHNNCLILKIGFNSHWEQKRKFFKIKDGVPEQKEITVYPNQYPKYPLNDTAPIISRNRPSRYITPRYQIPDNKMIQSMDLVIRQKYNGKWRSPLNAYKLDIGLIGPVNAGKSQLFGALSYPISAVSPKAATTTEVIHGIKSFERESEQGLRNVQLKYYDTPGLMYRKQGFISKGWKVLSEIDFTLLVVDSAKRFDNMVKQSIIRLERHRAYPNFMKALVLNKIDLVDNRRKFDSLISEIENYGKFDKIFYTSAKTGYGIQELQDYLIKMAKEGQWQYPAQVNTTSTDTEIMEEMLREGLFERLYKQVPHQAVVQCKSFLEQTNGVSQILFDVFVDSQNQQRMLIGKQGSNIQNAKKRFKVLYAKYFNKQAELQVSVKIKDDFRKRSPGREEIFVKDFATEDEQRLKLLEEGIEAKRLKKVKIVQDK